MVPPIPLLARGTGRVWLFACRPPPPPPLMTIMSVSEGILQGRLLRRVHRNIVPAAHQNKRKHSARQLTRDKANTTKATKRRANFMVRRSQGRGKEGIVGIEFLALHQEGENEKRALARRRRRPTATTATLSLSATFRASLPSIRGPRSLFSRCSKERRTSSTRLARGRLQRRARLGGGVGGKLRCCFGRPAAAEARQQRRLRRRRRRQRLLRRLSLPPLLRAAPGPAPRAAARAR